MLAQVVNKFKMRSDIQSYHLGGMGCATGVLAINLVNDLLVVRNFRLQTMVALLTASLTVHRFTISTCMQIGILLSPSHFSLLDNTC